MAGHISFNPLSTETSFLKNKSDPALQPSHIGEVSIIRTLNDNGPLRPNGFRRSRGQYATADNAPRTHPNGRVRVGTSAKNAMGLRNEIAARDFAYENRQIRSEGLSNHYQQGNHNLKDPAMVGMRRSRVRNQSNADDTGLLLASNLHDEGLNVAPRLRYAQGKNLKPAPARGALRGSRNKARARNEAARAQAEANARAQAARYEEAEQSRVNNRSRNPLNQEKERELKFITSQEENIKEADAIERNKNNRGNFEKLSNAHTANKHSNGGAYKKRRTLKKNKRHTRKHRRS